MYSKLYEPKKIFSQSDVIIDFTTPESTLQNIKFASDLRKPIVIGTTGLNDKIINLINANSKKIPILQSSNMSIGVNLCFNLLEKAAKVLGSDFDVEISEAEIYKARNNWQEAPDGQGFKDKMGDQGRGPAPDQRGSDFDLDRQELEDFFGNLIDQAEREGVAQ